MKNINVLFLFIFFAFILLTWIYIPDNVVDIFGKSIEKKHKNEISSYVSIKRVLAKKEMQMELKYINVRENLSHNRMGRNMKNKLEIKSTYPDKKRVGLNKLDVYKKEYMDRYNKKTGLAKMDCYFEKKLFDKIDYVNVLAEKWQKDKNSFKIKIFKKYGIYFLLFALLPLLGLIFPILFEGGDRAIITWCKKVHDANKKCKQKYMIHANEGILHAIENFNLIFFYIVLFIIVSVIIYTVIKVVKYERLKSGKDKMNAREYYNLSKELFLIK